MRVTNFMTHNKSLNNIHRNMRHLARIYEQTTSQKKITRPSQDPLIASRSLRFRTQLSNIEQFQQNVDSGNAWMNVSEASFFNLLRGDGDGSIFGTIIDELVAAANQPTGTLEDVLVHLKHIENLKNQIGLEMNQTIGGRYVFAGWRTDQPPVLMRDQLPIQPGNTPVAHTITQTFNVRDIENTLAFQRFPATNDPTLPGNELGFPNHHHVSIIKLPFRQTPENGAGLQTTISFGTLDSVPIVAIPGAPPPLGIFRADGVTPLADNIVARSLADGNAFEPDPNDIHYIVETGELVLGSAVVADFEDGIQVRYQVSNLRAGDLNPFVYFDTWSTVARVNPSVPNVGPFPGPVDTPPPDRHHWPQAPRQAIYYEFNIGMPVQVNSLSREVFSANMFADLRRLIDFARNLEPPDRRELEQIYGPGGRGYTGDALENAISRHMSDENNLIMEVLHSRINNMIRLMDTHTIDATREHTSLGVRMRRIEMVEIRLEQDEGNISRLKSENEDVDMTWALIQQSIAEAAFQGALRIIANNVQLSLVQFV